MFYKYRNKIIMGCTYSYHEYRKLDIKYDGSYDACCGASGLMVVVPQIAELLNKNIILVRKHTDGYS